jgi:3-hydroxyisobutyrate dehydrogenase
MTAIRTVAFVGLGNMGLPMATRLLAAGYTVKGFDLSADALERFAGIGGSPASSIADLATGADMLVLMLPDSNAVSNVMGDPAVLAALDANAIVVDMGSSEPLRTRELADSLAASGVRLVDAPVSGGVTGAVKGSLTIMMGGADDTVASVAEVLDHLGSTIHAGPVGAGHAIKALNNLLSATHLWATSEAMSVGSKLGLDPAVMLSVFNGSSGRSGSTENKWPNFVLPGTFDSGFALRLMLKDMRIATRLAYDVGAPTVLGAEATDLWAAAAEELDSGADHTEIARLIAQRNGD